MYKRIIFSFFIIPQLLSASGLWLYEGGSPEMGTAGAGRGAVANSASTTIYNPAGMTRLNESQLMLTIQPMYIDSQFSGDSKTLQGTQESGGNGANAGGLIPAGALYYVHSYSDKLKFGLSTASYFGLGLDYGESWKGRYFVTESSMMTLALSPTVAYKLNDQLSFGFGVNILYSQLKQTIIKRSDESSFKLKSDDMGYGFSLSTLYQPTQETRFGLMYTSKTDFEFDDVGPNDKANLKMDMPQSLTLSALHKLNDKWTILSSLGWQEWSEFGSADVQTDNTSINYDRHFDDTYHASIGAHYQFSTPLILMSGIAYDSSPVEDKYRTIDMPLDRQIRYAFGGTYVYSKKVTLGMAYELMDTGNAKIDQDGPLNSNISGEFKTNYVHIFNMNINYKF